MSLDEEWSSAKPDLKSEWEGAQASTSTYKPSTTDFVISNLAKGLTGAVGGLVDVPLNLGKAAYGMGRQLIGTALGEKPWEAASHAPDISWPVSDALFHGFNSPEQIEKMERMTQPSSKVGEYAQRALQFIGGSPVGGLANLPRNAAVAGVSGLTSQAAQDVFPNSNIAPVLGALAPSAARTSSFATRKVGEYAQRAFQAAQDVFPNSNIAPVLGALAPSAARRGLSELSPKTNTVLLANAQKANKLNLVVPPGEVQPTALNTVVGSIGGKEALAAKASRTNQPILNKIITDEIDNSAKKIGASLQSEDLNGLKDVRQKAGEVYDQASKLGTFTIDNQFKKEFGSATKQSSAIANEVPSLLDKTIEPLVKDFSGKKIISSKAVVESIKELRSQSQDNFASGNKGTARSQLAVANALEGLMERNIVPIQGKEFLQKFRDARELYAKTDDVLKAFNPTTGNFDSSVFARALKKNRPLTGGLRDVGEFATQFPSSARLPEKLGAPTSKVDAMLAAMFGSAGAAIKGGAGLSMAGIPLIAPPLSRSFLLSKLYQNKIINPQSTNPSSYLNTIAPIASQLPYDEARP